MRLSITSDICAICGEDFESQKKLLHHIRFKEKLSQQKYFTEHFPRYDLYSADLIDFKNLEQYKTARFNRRDHISRLAKKSGDEDFQKWRRELFVDLLKERVERKNLSVAPCDVELRTIMMPSVSDYDRVFDSGYWEACQRAEINPRFKYYSPDLPFDIPMSKEIKGVMTICVDTREQKPLSFGPSVNTRSLALDWADYIPEKPYFANVVVERKSLPDFVNTMSGGIERFKKEIERANAVGLYVVVVVESPLYKAKQYRGRFSQAKGAHIMHRMRSVLAQFNNVQFLFVRNREEAQEIIPRVFLLKADAKKLDLQYLYRNGSFS